MSYKNWSEVIFSDVNPYNFHVIIEYGLQQKWISFF